MKVILVKNYDELSSTAANLIIQQIKNKPDSILGLATGSSPIGTYNRLIESCKNNEISFSNIHTYNLDEYCGIDQNHPQSYYRFMREHLFDHIDIAIQNTHIPSATGPDLETECKKYNDALHRVTIDLQLLGIGANGHIGFNEPGTPFDQETFIVQLTESTRIANQRFFEALKDVPTHAVTMGIKNIMQSRKIVMLISGETKAEAAKRLLGGLVTTDFPASILQKHPDATIIIDESAAKHIK